MRHKYDLEYPHVIIAIMITRNPYIRFRDGTINPVTYIWADLGYGSSLMGRVGKVKRFKYLTKKETG